MGAELQLPPNLAIWLLLAALPLLLAACTAYTKIALVLAALRTGLGAERLLPLASLFALALVLTAAVMAPTAEACLAALEFAGGAEALSAAPLSTALAAAEPLWAFLSEHADAAEVELFVELGEGRLEADQPAVLIPAFLVSELARGCALAVSILVPFVAVDLICAQLLVLLGLGNTPITVVALPAKLVLFLAADGWTIVVLGLIEGYR